MGSLKYEESDTFLRRIEEPRKENKIMFIIDNISSALANLLKTTASDLIGEEITYIIPRLYH